MNWGLGHATRCVPLVAQFLAEGKDVVLAGNGESIKYLKAQFPQLRVLYLPEFDITYSKSNSQVWAILRSLPRLCSSYVADYLTLRNLLKVEHFDLVVSDNRFGLHSCLTHCVYITHQLLVRMPKGWQWLEGVVHRLHLSVIKRFDECWIPDFPLDAGVRLSGELTSRYALPANAKFIGPLSRFSTAEVADAADKSVDFPVVAILSGPEPQRTLFEQQICSEYNNCGTKVLLLRGKPSAPSIRITHNNITILPHLDDKRLARYLRGCTTIIARSGYSTIMDLYALGVLSKAKLRPTPGQPEQEYLARWIPCIVGFL